ncbi:RNA polymerase sigma factor ShbA [Amycolatopsis cynarae]|uniref:RNA polymerase sigma factor ShbA n=1 Tax=Amycolatopsis cynarae TaxID=2995223 RepID=A0ABY7B5S0_9PSEU|nr:RNA polymerase sigma factor ShbA [Amycolatopsis sp. HUAS 11-8]WAL67682.1 RNA polymerase sigma factor ShbA [Amycolatopsis sp. HUAS 11-8]
MTLCAEPCVDLESLARIAGDGDRNAVARLLAAIQPRVIRYCRGRIGWHHSTYASADDVAQEVLLAVFKALPSYRRSEHGFPAFVFGIAAHKVADFYRKRQREPVTPVADVPDHAEYDTGPEHAALEVELRHQVQQLLGTLTEAQRDILVHRVINEMSSEETAALMSSTPGAVRVAQYRALEKLRRLLKNRSTP